MKQKSNPVALLPIGVFLILYLGLGITLEYIMKVPMGFYNVPIIVAFLAAILVACLQNRSVSFDEKLEIMAKGLADKNIITMLLIFLTAGVFVGVVGRSSAESVAYFMLQMIPAKYAVMVLFVVACFVSDNLSFISDTTIAACNGQGCRMKDKFYKNFWIAFPAAVVTLILVGVISANTTVTGGIQKEYHLIRMIPYILVLLGGIAGCNVFLVLLSGIFSGSLIMLLTGKSTGVELIGNMGSGVSGMFETCMVAILVSAMCALIREYGGFVALLGWIQRMFKGKKGGQIGMGILVAAMDVATANNTVAIVMANPIAREMAKTYGVSAKKSASLLDTFSCITQGIIPYGAQMLVAVSAVSELGKNISAFDIIPFLFYPFFLLISSLAWIIFGKEEEVTTACEHR